MPSVCVWLVMYCICIFLYASTVLITHILVYIQSDGRHFKASVHSHIWKINFIGGLVHIYNICLWENMARRDRDDRF